MPLDATPWREVHIDRASAARIARSTVRPAGCYLEVSFDNRGLSRCMHTTNALPWA